MQRIWHRKKPWTQEQARIVRKLVSVAHGAISVSVTLAKNAHLYKDDLDFLATVSRECDEVLR